MPSSISAKNWLFIDAIGALISCLLIGVGLVHFQKEIGIPKNVLFILASIPAFFFCYSISCYTLLKSNWRKYLKIIAVANFAYCVLSIILISIFFKQISTLGMVYFITEITVILALVIQEWKDSLLNSDNL